VARRVRQGALNGTILGKEPWMTKTPKVLGTAGLRDTTKQGRKAADEEIIEYE
jgi:hypothetical protein